MTLLVDIKTFLVSARTGGFSAAAREIRTTPSVISKRVNRLEAEVGAQLFHRSTRHLTLTPEGERLVPQLQVLVAELEETLANVREDGRELRGNIRVRAPTTLGTMFVGPSVARFQAMHRLLTVDLVIIDRQVNPLEEGLDISLGARPQSFASVSETVFCPYRRILVASPSYLEGRPQPKQPADIADHDCIAFVPVGLNWNFEGPGGPYSIDIRPRCTVNDSRVLVDAAMEGLGLAVVPEFLARKWLAEGDLVQVMPDYPVVQLWFKAMVPRHKSKRPEIIQLVDYLQGEFSPAPWDRPSADRLWA